MKKLQVVGFLAVAVFLPPYVLSQTNTIAHDSSIVSEIRLIEAWIESQMDYSGIPGMSVGVVYDQNLIWSRGFGFSDIASKAAATPQTKYRIASISKLFTSTAIMQLRDDGKLQLFDPIVKHLPWFNMHNRYTDAPPITVEHLITHTSGLPREAAFPYWTDNRFPTFDQIKEKIPQQEIVYPPDTLFKYSNLAVSLAGQIVQKVSAEAYADYVQKHIFDPLGMNNSSVNSDKKAHEGLATGYGRRMPDGTRDVRPYQDVKGITPAGNITSTVEDLARFVSLQFRNGRRGGSQILDSRTLHEMHRVHWLCPDWKGGYGIGFFVSRQGDRTIIGHGGALDGYRSTIVFDEEAQIGVIVLINANDGDVDKFANRIFNLIAPVIKKAASAVPAAQVAHPEWNKYVGLYRDPWGDSRVLIIRGELILIDPTLDDPEGSLYHLVPSVPHIFKIVADKTSWGEIGEFVVFELGPDGNVIRMKLGENYIPKVR